MAAKKQQPSSRKGVHFIEDVDAWPETQSDRTVCKFTIPSDPAKVMTGLASTRLVEWGVLSANETQARLDVIVQRIPCGADPVRDEEARTLEVKGIFESKGRVAVMYSTLLGAPGAAKEGESPYGQICLQPITLRDVLLKVPKPSPADRRVLSRIVMTQVRSLHVHFQVVHGALRADSFVFFDSKSTGSPDLKRPYVLDWTRSPTTPGVYQHPGFRPASPSMWAYDVWAALMVLSEIAEWKPLGPDELGGTEDVTERELLQRKKARKDQVTGLDWKGEMTANLFRFGFAAIDRDFDELEKCGKWEIKKFWDKFCDMLGPDR